MALNVGVLGSCRVHLPLKIATQAGKFTLVQDKVMGFIHNTREMMQAIELLKGRRSADRRFFKLLNVGNDDALAAGGDIFTRAFRDVDVFVVELSSIRLIEYAGLYLQIHRFRDTLMTGVGGDQLTRKLLRPLPEWRSAVEQYLLANNLDAQAAEILCTAVLSEQTAETIRQDLEVIKAELGRPLFLVCHFVMDDAGRPVKQRAMIRDAVAEFAADHPDDVGWFDPTPHVEAVGHAVSVKDLGHYRPGFEPMIAEAMASSLLAWHGRTFGPAMAAAAAPALAAAAA